MEDDSTEHPSTTLALRTLADENRELRTDNAGLREANRQLVDLVADLAWDVHVAQVFADNQLRQKLVFQKREARRFEQEQQAA